MKYLMIAVLLLVGCEKAERVDPITGNVVPMEQCEKVLGTTSGYGLQMYRCPVEGKDIYCGTRMVSYGVSVSCVR